MKKIITAFIFISVVLGNSFASADSEDRPKKCFIKGLVRFGEKIYYTPGDKKYYDLAIDVGRGDRWFCSEMEAEKAGWRGSMESIQNPEMIRSDGSPMFTPHNYPFTNVYVGIAGGISIPFNATNISETGNVGNVSVNITSSDLRVSTSPAWGVKSGAFLERLPWLGFEVSYYERYPDIPKQNATVAVVGRSGGQLISGSGQAQLAADINQVRTLGFAAIVKPKVDSFLHPYIGGGLAVNFVGTKEGRSYTTNGIPVGTTLEKDKLAVAVGPLAIMGVEANITKNISAFSEAKYTRSNFEVDGFDAPLDLNFTFSDIVLFFGLAFRF